MIEKPWVKSYCGGKPNYCTPDVDAVNISQKRVDETAKREHEPWPSVQCVCGGTIYFKYTPPISDYHEGLEEGFKAATLEHEPVAYEFIPNKELLYPHELERQPDANYIPLYTAPPKREWFGLTDEEINDWFFQRLKQAGAGWRLDDVIKAVEAKLKEKNT